MAGDLGRDLRFNGIGVKGAEAFRTRVREDVERGADLIKVCVSGWLAEAVANRPSTRSQMRNCAPAAAEGALRDEGREDRKERLTFTGA